MICLELRSDVPVCGFGQWCSLVCYAVYFVVVFGLCLWCLGAMLCGLIACCVACCYYGFVIV